MRKVDYIISSTQKYKNCEGNIYDLMTEGLGEFDKRRAIKSLHHNIAKACIGVLRKENLPIKAIPFIYITMLGVDNNNELPQLMMDIGVMKDDSNRRVIIWTSHKEIF